MAVTLSFALFNFTSRDGERDTFSWGRPVSRFLAPVTDLSRFFHSMTWVNPSLLVLDLSFGRNQALSNFVRFQLSAKVLVSQKKCWVSQFIRNASCKNGHDTTDPWLTVEPAWPSRHQMSSLLLILRKATHQTSDLETKSHFEEYEIAFR